MTKQPTLDEQLINAYDKGYADGIEIVCTTITKTLTAHKEIIDQSHTQIIQTLHTLHKNTNTK